MVSSYVASRRPQEEFPLLLRPAIFAEFLNGRGWERGFLIEEG